MTFTFDSGVIIDNTTFSRLVYGVDDGSTTLTSNEKANVEFTVNAVNDQILQFIDRNILANDYVEVWDSVNSDELIVKEFPINSVASIKYAFNNDFVNGTTVDSSFYYPQKESIVFHGWSLPTGRAVIQITYNAGYSLANVPKSLILGLVEQFKTTYSRMNFGTIDAPSNYESVSKMGESFTVSKKISENGLSPQVIQLISDFKRIDAPLSKMFAMIQS